MLPSTFTVTRNILAVKRDRETFLCTEDQAQQIEDAIFQKIWRIKLVDAKWKMIFWWDPKEIKEFREDTRDMKRQIQEQEDMEQTRFRSQFMANKNKKIEWTKNQMKVMNKEEIECFIEQAKNKLSWAVKKEYVWEKFIREYAMCLLRKHFKYPYA